MHVTRLTQKKANQSTRMMKPFRPGDKVWYRRPENSGEKVDTRWLGPVRVSQRVGEASYEIEVDEGVFKQAPRRFLKEYVEDKWNGRPVPLFFHKRTVVDPDAAPDEWIVDKILNHRSNGKGGYEFLTHFQGTEEHEATWEPLNSFFHRYSSDLIKYCKAKGLYPDLTRVLKSTPTQED